MNAHAIFFYNQRGRGGGGVGGGDKQLGTLSLLIDSDPLNEMVFPVYQIQFLSLEDFIQQTVCSFSSECTDASEQF